MAYELWNRATRNIVGDFDDESSALNVIRHAIANYGDATVADWVLGFEDEAGETTVVAAGTELVDRVRKMSVAGS